MSKLIFLDTNLFIYFFQHHPLFGEPAKEVFEQVVTGKYRGLTSVITQVELLSLTATDKTARYLQDLFVRTPNLTIAEIDSDIATQAAKIRRQYGFRTPDSLQLATAIVNGASLFYTNDKQLQKCREIKVKLLS